MRVRNLAIITVLATAAALGQTTTPSGAPELLSSIRTGDQRRVQDLLRSGADPNVADEVGSTALMHAAAFATPEIVRLLLDAGADPKKANKNGATALMWTGNDVEQVRLLLNRGSDVNAERSDGVTPLVAAALRGNVETMRLLLAAGADVGKGSVLAPFPMTLSGIAYTTNDPSIRELLSARDLTPPKIPTSAPAGTPQTTAPLPFASWILTTTFSWRPQPNASSAGLVRALLEAGANPNETITQLTLTAPALARVVRLGDLEAARVLLDSGADPNIKGSSGWTPLMAATLAESGEKVVQLLLDRGARANLRDEAGRTALDWALLKGESEAARILREAGAVEMAPPPPPPAPVRDPRTPREAIQQALRQLQPASKTFKEKAPCISCHNQSLPEIAFKLAKDKGIPVDPEISRQPAAETQRLWNQARENLLAGNCSIFGFIQNVSYGMLGLAEEGLPRSSATDAATSCLSGLQKPDGSWEGNDSRPPLSGRTPLVYTALAVRGLKTYSPEGRREVTAQQINRARNFLRRAIPNGTQEESFKLLGLIWSGAPSSEISAQSRKLQTLQRPEGGWGQYPGMKPDPYATGQAMYALHAAGVTPNSASYRNGVQYLLRTQLEDGTWYMHSRAMGFQPYIEAGFPHGPDQFISTAATAWAVIALSYGL